MKSIYCSIFFLLFSFAVSGQVGIGTVTPSSTLEITAANPTGTATTVDGILIPRVTRERAQSMTGTPTSTIIYVTEVITGTATGTTSNVNTIGFYFFNGTSWQTLSASAATNWTTTGNSGLSGTTNFLGTTDDIDLAFKRNNVAAGKIQATSTSFGVGALGTSTAINNTAIGANALTGNTSGTSNVALGFSAGSAITTGSNNIMIGTSTVAPSATASDQLNIGNTIFGSMAGALTSGVNTTRTIGINVLAPQAALDITSSNNGLLIPRVSLLNTATVSPVTTGRTSEIVYNTATINDVTPGFYYLSTNTGPWIRFATGTMTGWSTTGNTGLTAGTNFMGTTDNVDVSFKRFNTAAGFIGTSSTAFGVSSLAANTTGANNTAFGTNALAANVSPSNNTAFGYNALAINNVGADSGALNTAVGSGALANLNGGNNNTAVGYNALTAIPTTTRFNTAVGSNSLSGINSNAAINNVAVGDNTMTGSGVITRTVAIGSNALVNASNGSTRNTAIGAYAGSATSNGTDNVFIGNAAGSAEAGTSSNKLYIENTNADASNALIYGEFDTNTLRVNGTLQVNNPAGANGYALPNVRGTNGQILQTNGAGATSWANPTTVKPYTTTGVAVAVYNVSLTEYTVRVFNFATGVNLPAAAGNLGKVFVIIGSNTITAKPFTTSGGTIYDDVTNTTINTLNPNQRFTVQSDGTDWIVIGQ